MLKRKFEEMEQKVVSTQKKNIELQHILNSYIQSTKEIATKYKLGTSQEAMTQYPWMRKLFVC